MPIVHQQANPAQIRAGPSPRPDMPADRPYPAPFDTSTFILPTEWHAFSDLLGGADTGLLFLRDGVVLHLNTHLAAQLGFDEQELVGRPIESLVAKAEADADDRTQVRLMTKSGAARDFSLVENRIDALTDARCTIWVLRPVVPRTEAGQPQGGTAGGMRRLHYVNRLLHLAQRPHANLASALKVILKSAAKALGAHRCAYWEVSDDPAATRCLMAYDDLRQNLVDEEPDATFATVVHPLLLQVLRSEHQMVIADVDQDPRAAIHCEYFHAKSIKALMMMPVRHGDRFAGLLIVSQFDQARQWRRDESDFADNVAGLITLIIDEVERSRAQAQSRHLAQHDRLTGLPNREFLFEQASDIFPKLSAKANTLAAFFIDIDGFKHVNDDLGYDIGDELLKASVLRLKNLVRRDDILARLGGDEFVLLARDLSDMRVADDIASQIVEAMRAPFSLQGRELLVSASVGIALYPFDGADLDTLMKKADIAMGQAKAAGRNRYRMFTPGGDWNG